MTQNGSVESDIKENQDPNGSSSGGAHADKDEQITIFHDKDNFNVKHPLIHEWTLWFTKPPSGKVSDSVATSWNNKKCRWPLEGREGCIEKWRDFIILLMLTRCALGRQLE